LHAVVVVVCVAALSAFWEKIRPSWYSIFGLDVQQHKGQQPHHLPLPVAGAEPISMIVGEETVFCFIFLGR
jgi:hypothetical protein